MKETTCCFFGHKKINVTEELKAKVYETVEGLITEQNVDTFLFGSNSQFDSLCLETVTRMKEKYPHIKRIYVRAEYPYINESYTAYLLKYYDETYFPEKMIEAGRAVYVERNREMIDKSLYCVFYYDENYAPQTRKNSKNLFPDCAPQTRKSGTKLALDYAILKKKKIITMSLKFAAE